MSSRPFRQKQCTFNKNFKVALKSTDIGIWKKMNIMESVLGKRTKKPHPSIHIEHSSWKLFKSSTGAVILCIPDGIKNSMEKIDYREATALKGLICCIFSMWNVRKWTNYTSNSPNRGKTSSAKIENLPILAESVEYS